MSLRLALGRLDSRLVCGDTADRSQRSFLHAGRGTWTSNRTCVYSVVIPARTAVPSGPRSTGDAGTSAMYTMRITMHAQ